MSYQAREVACHAIEKFIEKLQTGGIMFYKCAWSCKDEYFLGDSASLKVHCFRAILESLIERHQPNMRHTPMKSVRIDTDMTFLEYYHKAVRGMNIHIPEEELDSEYVKSCLAQFKRVLVFYSLRLLIAPLIESLILLDFISYLRENGISTALLPLFDPILSPRNTVLIAIKEEMNKMNL